MTPAPARLVWLDTRLVCVVCASPFYGVIPRGEGWTFLTCQDRRGRDHRGKTQHCGATWIALTLPPNADGYYLRTVIGRECADALLELLVQRPGQPIIGETAVTSYLQVRCSGTEFHRHAQREPLEWLLSTFQLRGET